MAPNDELYELNVGNILGGKFPDIFARAFQQLIANMRDPNTPAEAVRKVTFEFTIEPNSDRSVGDITLKTPLKLAGIESITGTLYVSQAGGKLQAYCRDLRQEVLWDKTAGGEAKKQ